MGINRDELQDGIVNKAIKAGRGIIDVAPRVGKCRIGVKILQHWLAPKALIVYPDNKIKLAWEEEFEKMDYSNPNLVFTSTRSLKKWMKEEWDIIIFDECHMLSEANIQDASKTVLEKNIASFGLSGTISLSTSEEFQRAFKWSVIASYTQEQAISDGIVADYRINVIKVPLDNKRLIQYKKKRRTEKQQFDAYTSIIKKLMNEEKDTFFLRLARMRIIQGSIAKMEATRKLLKEHKDDRIIVFCGLIKIAEQLGIPVQHSKSDGDELDKFAKGEGNHIAVIRMGNMGRTYAPLNMVVINYFDSNEENLKQRINRAMNLEFKGQTAEIYIICSVESVENQWLQKALSPFDPLKINYL